MAEASRLLSLTQQNLVRAAARWQAEVASARVQARVSLPLPPSLPSFLPPFLAQGKHVRAAVRPSPGAGTLLLLFPPSLPPSVFPLTQEEQVRAAARWQAEVASAWVQARVSLSLAPSPSLPRPPSLPP